MPDRYGDTPPADMPAPYAGCWHVPCPVCGAGAGSRCSFVDGFGVRLGRHAPCIARMTTRKGRPA